VRELIPEWPQVASWRQIMVGIDTGADHPFGANKIVSTERGLVVVGEYLERHKSFIEHAGSMKRLAGINPAQVKWAINKNERQPMIELAQHGIMCMPAQNDIVAGTERVKSWLHTKQLWFVESTCPKTIKQMKAYRWDEPKTRDGQMRNKEKVFKKEDELPDCIRYALMTWPRLPQPVVDLNPKRDLSALPAEMRGAIERLRKIDNDKRTEPERNTDVAGDFYL
jgi:hypothetical protein